MLSINFSFRRFLPALAVAALAFNYSSRAAEFFVSPAGNDTNSGTQARPFASFERAQAAARSARSASPETSVVVTFAAGVYPLTRPLEFTPLDSGFSSRHPTIYRAAPKAEVIISGGRRITGWQKDSQRPGLWKTRIEKTKNDADGKWRFEQLWVNGARATRARTPNAGDFAILKNVVEESSGNSRRPYRHTFTVKPDDVAALQGLTSEALQDVQIVVFHKWDTTREWLREADPKDGRMVTEGAIMKWWNPMERGGLYSLENFLGALDAPGEWFLDREGWLYYRPQPGEDMHRAEVIAPVLEQLMSIQGGAEHPVQHVRFEGLKFQHAELRIPPEGYAPNQAAMNVTAAAIQVDHARRIQFIHCAVEHIGSTAIWFRRNTQDCGVEHSRLFDLGVSGVRIGEIAIVPQDVRTSRITVENCIIQSGGRIRPDAVGIWIGHSPDNTIRHCDIGDFFYTAISAGWRWGYGENGAKRNLIEFNHLHHIGYGMLSDMAGVYTLGKSEGTVVRNNVIHDVYAGSYGGWGLYCDEGSSGILFENNLVYDVLDGGMHQHYGRENIFRNNIMAFSREMQISVSRPEPHVSFTFERNLVYWDGGELLGYGGWNGAKVNTHTNLYWRAAGRSFNFDGKSWEEWRAAGHDAGSIIADPLFVDAGKRDFRLQPESPASQIGFQPFNPQRAGVYGSSAWKKLATDRSWPEPYVKPLPEPVQFSDDFEEGKSSVLLSVAALSQGKRSDLIVITNDPGDVNNRCLQFKDVPGLDRDFYPFLNWNPHYSSGAAKLKFAIRLEANAQAKCEWRNDGRGIAGPSVDFRDEGVWVRGRKLIAAPTNTWFEVEMHGTLGQSEPRWDLSVTLPGQSRREFKDLTCDQRWSAVGWAGFISTATNHTLFHLDNIEMVNPGSTHTMDRPKSATEAAKLPAHSRL